MANSYAAKVNRTVQYRTAAGKVLPAVITAVTSPTVATLRVGHATPPITFATKTRRSGDGVKNDRWFP